MDFPQICNGDERPVLAEPCGCYGRQCEFGDLTTRHSIGVQPRTSSSEADLSLASKDANVSFLQQVTIERPKSNGSSQS
jgi:hypothetical protein